MMNATQSGSNLTASLIRAKSRLSPESVSGLEKLQKVEDLLSTAHDTLAHGEMLSEFEVQRLNGALDELMASHI